MSRIIPSHWGHQTKFRTEAQALANSIFDELDPSLRPNVLLVGLVSDHDKDLYPLFVDAPGQDYSPNLFSEASRRARELRAKTYGENGDSIDPLEKRRIVLDTWRLAVEEVLAESDDATKVVSFCSAPRPVEEFLVSTVLQLDRNAWRAYFALRQDEDDQQAARPASLLEATVLQYMRKCAVGLAERHAGMYESVQDLDHEEILRAAGRILADYPALGGQRDLNLRGLFNACNTISSLRYEGGAGVGALIISQPGHEGVKVRVKLRRPVRLYDYTAVRKMLETTRPGYALLSDGAVVYGIGALNLAYSVPGESLFQVSFQQHYVWELSYGARVLMRVSYGHPRLPRLSINEGRFRVAITRTFGMMESDQFDRLWEMALAATKQAHGTILVIGENAAKEAERLAKQSAPIDPIQVDEEGLLALSSVDGAMLMDPDGVVHAFGVILDGRASTKGDPARGARFNSALRYVDSSESPCMAIVVSEDGGVDVIPGQRRS